MATTDDSNDALWNQSVCNKSWVEIMEEEERVCSANNSLIGEKNSSLLRDSTNTTLSNRKVTIKEPLEDESAMDANISIDNKDIKIEPSDILPNFSTSLTSKSEAKSKENSTKVQVKEEQKCFLNEDSQLSLTSHLNGFQLVSPCKVEAKTSSKSKTPTKTPTKPIGYYLRRCEAPSSPGQTTKRKLQTSDQKDVSDDMLMPSPSKIRRQATPVKKPLSNTPKKKSHTPKQNITPNFLNFTPTNKLTRKRYREHTPGSSEKKRDIETDPEVLARRQKQIDYGKNTVGYDRYRQLVPKEARTKIHPKTPPLHIKFSRRAWDGLVKVWRQRLHFWDPPSEGGGDPACLEIDDMSETSSTDGSLPPTPVQEKKRTCWLQRTPNCSTHKGNSGSPATENADDDDDDQGCVPLPPE